MTIFNINTHIYIYKSNQTHVYFFTYYLSKSSCLYYIYPYQIYEVGQNKCNQIYIYSTFHHLITISSHWLNYYTAANYTLQFGNHFIVNNHLFNLSFNSMMLMKLQLFKHIYSFMSVKFISCLILTLYYSSKQVLMHVFLHIN